MKQIDDWMPDSAVNTRDWCAEFLANGPAKLLALGWAQPRIDALVASVTKVHTAADATVKAQQALDAASGTFKNVRAAEIPAIREGANGIKATPGADDGLATALGILSTSTTVVKSTYQPKLDAATVAHGIQITGKKLGATSLNLYYRLRGQSGWKLLAAKRVRFPFLDETPPAVAGQSEMREYRAIGVDGDDEFGQPSDIVTATFNP